MSRFWKQSRSLLLGLAAGAVAGYTIVRTIEALTPDRSTIRHDAAEYGRLRRRLAMAQLAGSLCGSVAFSYGSGARRLSRVVEPLPTWARPAAFAALASAAGAITDAPIAIVEEYRIERRYGLSEQRFASFATDMLKSSALEIVMSALLAAGAAPLVARFKRSWPFFASIASVALYALANLIVPLYILPLFNRFERLEGPLEQRLRALATRYGVGDAEILTMNMSKQTKKANAFVTGIGATHRIVLGDTLVENFPVEEIEFVVAHELGHYVSKDTWRLIAAAGAATSVLLFAAAQITCGEAADAVALTRIATVVGIGSTALRPALAGFSRSREWAADRFARAATENPRAGAAAFARLRDQNLAEDDVPAWYEFFFSTHPSLGKRIAALRDGDVDERSAAHAY